jgi:8-amino-7-oxononanoate synthase
MDLPQIVNCYEAQITQRKFFKQYRKLQKYGARLSFASNDYLNLSQHPDVLKASQDFTQRYGVGAKASRLLGELDEVYQVFEKIIAECKHQEKALIFASGFQANVSVLAALLDASVLKDTPLVFSDRLNHASMHLGCAAAHVGQHRYRHLDLNHLEQLLKSHQESRKPKFILTESVFGMDGDCVDLMGLVFLAEKYQAFLYVDEAHATGLYGPDGYGLTAPLGSRIHLAMGTFSKALGGFGAYVATSEAIYEYLVNRCGGFVYSTALPASMIGAAQAAWSLLPHLGNERAHIKALATQLAKSLKEQGLNIGETTTHIIPLILKDSGLTLKAHKSLQDLGIHVSAIRPPTVPAQASRLRIALRADHTLADLERLLEGLRFFFQKDS